MTRHPVPIRGVTYPSQRAAARVVGVRVKTLRQADERGTLDALGMGRARPCVIDGVSYPSRTAAARALGVAQSTISKRLARDRSPA